MQVYFKTDNENVIVECKHVGMLGRLHGIEGRWSRTQENSLKESRIRLLLTHFYY